MTARADASALNWLREAVAALACIGPGKGHQIAPAAHLSRLGLVAPDYDHLARAIRVRWGVVVEIHTHDRVSDVARRIDAALGRSVAGDDDTIPACARALRGLLP